eukprot:CAMPEP_0195528768 /NCGR_PEP_ID=MMETSP0794_2-20130614/31054_1 /TAXON_ID=515487 /ORGANISM="Stephanopyxis turris, Strain CCMP 815" /LENGTH=506 /DNA_ID=CAMNT_0040659957 /DNA_START=204 /DNA_END=1724 /DNA_ORIENTATION=+
MTRSSTKAKQNIYDDNKKNNGNKNLPAEWFEGSSSTIKSSTIEMNMNSLSNLFRGNYSRYVKKAAGFALRLSRRDWLVLSILIFICAFSTFSNSRIHQAAGERQAEWMKSSEYDQEALVANGKANGSDSGSMASTRTKPQDSIHRKHVQQQALKQQHQREKEKLSTIGMDTKTKKNKMPWSLEKQPKAVTSTITNITIPESLSKLADLSKPFLPGKDLPYFWHVALSGGTAMEKIIGACLQLVQASDVETSQGHIRGSKTLQLVKLRSSKYLNMDITSPVGISKAKVLKLASSNMVDVVVTTALHETAAIFTSKNKARMFALFRHPIERAISMFYYLKTATWDEGHDSAMVNMTILEYANSGQAENNWLTRFLINKRGGAIQREDLAAAKEVLRTKCLVGLLSEFAVSLERFEAYFRWDQPKLSNDSVSCQNELIALGDNRHNHPTFEEGSEVWEALIPHNRFDMEVYEYAKQLFFEEQANIAIASRANKEKGRNALGAIDKVATK